MLKVTTQITIPLEEIELRAIRAQGSGGQNVNKVSTAIHLRFDVSASSLSDTVKQKLLALPDQRLNNDGILVLKAQQYRSQEKNREAALQRLREIIRDATFVHKVRRATKPTRSSQAKRMDAKVKHGKTKAMRTNKEFD